MRRLVLLPWFALAWVLGALLAVFTVLVIATLRLKSPPVPEGPAVLACWHRHLPLTIPLAGRHRCWTMMSPAPYMAPIAAWARLLGLRLVRGTSRAGGRDALKVLAEKVRDGEAVLLAVDGPHGPPFVAKSGCAELAAMSGAPLFAFGFQASRELVLPTWDRQTWPMPFSRVEVVLTQVDGASGELLEATQEALVALAPCASSR